MKADADKSIPDAQGEPRTNLLGKPESVLAKFFDGLGEKPFRARQVLQWIHQRNASRFDEMTDLSRNLREQLCEIASIELPEVVSEKKSSDGTVKWLFESGAGQAVETVFIPEPGRGTLCISSQVGCAMDCSFCATGAQGFNRNLDVNEIIGQVTHANRHLPIRANGEPAVTNVVFMGMGEPLANYEATVEAVRRLNAKWGLGLAQRRITVSTVGLPKQIERLAAEDLQITLALSLHAPTQELREELIPWARGTSLSRLLAACHTYRRQTGREITLEYCLLAEVNDHPDHASRLATIACDLGAHINLLVYNPVQDLPFARPSRNRVIAFLKQLRQLGAKAHLRESRGLEADAACGQLRRRNQS